MAPETIRVLVVDDSAYMRKAIREMLDQDPHIQVIGTAFDGQDALEKVTELKPDVVTVDLYMPELGGVGFVQAQMNRQPLPIVLCSSADENAKDVIAAMEAGAVEFVQKPTAQALDRVLTMKEDLIRAVTAAGSVAQKNLKQITPTLPGALVHSFDHKGSINAVLLGVSTGGPRALRYILPGFPADFPVPIAVVLHMPVGYTQPLAQKLDEICAMEVLESCEGLEMQPGRIILAQAGLHTRLLRRTDGLVVTTLSDEPKNLLYCPSVDELFRSGVNAYGSRVLGVVLTGMGNDGTLGSAWIKSGGGQVFVEDESTSVVYGMPRSVVEAGLADQVIPLDQVAEKIMEAVG